MRISVVVCTHTEDRYSSLCETIESVLAQTHEDRELIVVSDGSPTVARRARADYGVHDNVRVHRNETNRGLLASRNTGAELAEGDVVAFIDDDAVAHKDWLAELAATYEVTDEQNENRTHEPLAVGGRMTPRWVAGKPEYLPEEFYWLVGVTHRGFGHGMDTPSEVRNTNGSNISFDREVFLELDGFNATIGGRKGDKNLQGGETELCARLRSTYGVGVQYNPDARVAHKVFDYRTKLWWLIDRAFWQGYSKRGMEILLPESSTAATAEETEFLHQLLGEFVPKRFARLVRTPTTAALSQLVMLFVLTGAVGVGYLYGALAWRSSGSTLS